MNLEKIMNVLADKGIKSAPMNVVKNNVEFHGLRLYLPDNPTVSPVVYYADSDTTELFLHKINTVLDLNPVQINAAFLTNLEYVKDHIFPGIQRLSNLDSLHGVGTCKVTARQLQALGVSEKDLCFPDFFQQFCRNIYEQGCFILPSSTDDLVILPKSSLPLTHRGLQELTDMVHTINQDSVAPEIQLDPVVYYYDYFSNTIEIVAEHKEDL